MSDIALLRHVTITKRKEKDNEKRETRNKGIHFMPDNVISELVPLTAKSFLFWYLFLRLLCTFLQCIAPSELQWKK